MTTDHSHAPSVSLAAAPEATGTASLDFDRHSLTPSVDVNANFSANTELDTSDLRSHLADGLADLKSDAGETAHQTIDSAIDHTPRPAHRASHGAKPDPLANLHNAGADIATKMALQSAISKASTYIPSVDTLSSGINQGKHLALASYASAAEKTGELYSLASQKTGELYAGAAQTASEFVESDAVKQGTETAKGYKSALWSYVSENPGTSLAVGTAVAAVGYGGYRWLAGRGRRKDMRSASRSSQRSKK